MTKPKQIELKHRGVDSATMTRVFEKYKRGEKERSEAQQSMMDLDEKSKILFDRVTKKHASIRNKQGELSDFFMDDPSALSYAPKKGTKKIEESVCFEDDSYTHLPRLINIRKLPPQNIYTERGVPFWAEYLEPTDEDMKDVAEPISISSGHLEMYHKKELVLRKTDPMNVVLNAFQPLSDLMKRDEIHFDYRLVFSNTICSLVHVLERDFGKQVKKSKEKVKSSEKKISFDAAAPVTVVYSVCFSLDFESVFFPRGQFID
uniref:DNA-directed RNA polymerase III subunit RPC5 n=1 Tax=Caenorhabditis tropicalis TaxID=1561998 RepID=A0A1I7U3L2_9PELO